MMLLTLAYLNPLIATTSNYLASIIRCTKKIPVSRIIWTKKKNQIDIILQLSKWNSTLQQATSMTIFINLFNLSILIYMLFIVKNLDTMYTKLHQLQLLHTILIKWKSIYFVNKFYTLIFSKNLSSLRSI